MHSCTLALHCIVGLQSPNCGAQLKVLELRPSPDTNQEGSNLTLCTAASASCGSCCGLDNISVLEKSSWGYQKPKLTLLRLYGRGGSSSGSTSDYESGSGFDSRWELGFFLYSSLSYRSVSLIHSWRCKTTDFPICIKNAWHYSLRRNKLNKLSLSGKKIILEPTKNVMLN